MKQLPSQSHLILNEDALRPKGPLPQSSALTEGARGWVLQRTALGLLHPKRLRTPPSTNLKQKACLLPPLRFGGLEETEEDWS